MVSDSGSSIIDAVAQGRQQLPALRCFINLLTSDLTPGSVLRELPEI